MPVEIDIQGHRGARGHFPENTLAGFLAAVDMGVHTIELDVVISADSQVVVSHEAWMNDAICSLPDGKPLMPGTGENYNLFRMTYEEIRQFDCGKRGHPDFHGQRCLASHKPLLREVIAAVEKHAEEKRRHAVNYNIELKTEPETGLFNPGPAEFVGLVYREVRKHLTSLDRISIQSFDARILNEMRKKDNSITIGLLVENQDSIDLNLQRLGFLPDIYSPEFRLVTEHTGAAVHKKGMKLIPWTVNDKKDMISLISLGVDGIISDYPDRVVQVTTHKI